MVILALAHGATFLGVHGVRMGSTPSVISALEATSPRVGSLFGASILVTLRVIGWVMLAAIPASIVAIVPIVLIPGVMGHGASAGATPNPASFAAIGVIAVLIGVVFVLAFLVFAYWTYARYILFVPVIMEEELGANASIRRSIQLSRGSRGRIYALLGIILLLGIIPVPIVFTLAFLGAKHPGIHGLALSCSGNYSPPSSARCSTPPSPASEPPSATSISAPVTPTPPSWLPQLRRRLQISIPAFHRQQSQLQQSRRPPAPANSPTTSSLPRPQPPSPLPSLRRPRSGNRTPASLPPSPNSPALTTTSRRKSSSPL